MRRAPRASASARMEGYPLSVTDKAVLERLAGVTSPQGVPLPQTGALSEISVTDGKVFFSISVDAAEASAWEGIRVKAENAVRGLAGVKTVLAVLTAERKPGAAASAPPPRQVQRMSGAGGQPPPIGRFAGSGSLPGIGAVIAVASGKGGVGKSTTSVNLALGLRDLGLRVGVLDADIYGPSVPRLFGISEKPQVNNAKKLMPIWRFGIAVMSIGFLVEDRTALIWRGPMISTAITQLLRDVEWGRLDVLVIDMPPGTGDIQLTLSQQAPLKGAVIVSTPQDLALIDARRGVAMFNRINVPVLGVIENMSYFRCPACGARADIFGHGGARREAERLAVPFLGEVPLHASIRELSDAGTPVVEAEPAGEHAGIYRAIATAVRDQLRAKALVA